MSSLFVKVSRGTLDYIYMHAYYCAIAHAGRSCTSPNDSGNIRLVPLLSAGAIQICFNSQESGIFWSYVNSELSETAAQVSCKQLGFLNARELILLYMQRFKFKSKQEPNQQV